jgi:glycyl-tRNA synthetase beta chain
MVETLLVELLTEELPPKALGRLGQSLAEAIYADLRKRQLTEENAASSWFATPRRLAVTVTRVRGQAPDQQVLNKLMPLAVAFDAGGKPTQALLKKLATKGLSESVIPHLARQRDGKAETVFYAGVTKGEVLAQCLADVVAEAIRELPIPKLMRWGGSEAEFVRPVHGLVLLHGDRIVPGEVLGLTSGNRTRGHRFMGEGEILIDHADRYADILREKGRVIADFDARLSEIRRQIKEKAGDARPMWSNDLLDEVTALVEWVNVLEGHFDRDFLAVPQECLILAMQRHQKYFPLMDDGGRLLPRFLLVSNLAPQDPVAVVCGNERVLRARLSDARFFYDQDRRTRLADRLPGLSQVVYHNKLGSQLERVERLVKLSGEIARRLNADVAAAERAAYLAKADLGTDMVGEFPELQGVMGRYYALHDGEEAAVAAAIEQHYRPRFANDALPDDNVGAAVALADKLDTLVGIYGIGLAPTGEKDPFGLRRAALGVLRILAEKELPLDLRELLTLAKSHFPKEILADSVVVDIFEFTLERLRSYLREPFRFQKPPTPMPAGGMSGEGEEQDYTINEIEAALAVQPERIDRIRARLDAIRKFSALPEAGALAAANKRIRNILKKAEAAKAEPDSGLMTEEAEKALHAAVLGVRPGLDTALANGDYTGALLVMAPLKPAVDRFFEEVMVMTDEPLIRANRLALLASLGRMMNSVADISRLST